MKSMHIINQHEAVAAALKSPLSRKRPAVRLGLEQKQPNTTKQEGSIMTKIIGLSELAEIIESNNRIEKAGREIKKNRIAELMAQGIDRELAKVMVDAGLACGVQL